jgi:hypothetical protein
MVEDKEELCHLATLHGVRRAATLTKKKLVEALEVEIEKLPRYANLRGMVLRLIDKVSLSGLPRGIYRALEDIGDGGEVCGRYCCPSCLEDHSCGEQSHLR